MQALLHKRALLPARRVGQPAVPRRELRVRPLEPPVRLQALQQAQRLEPPQAPPAEQQVQRVERLRALLVLLRVQRQVRLERQEQLVQRARRLELLVLLLVPQVLLQARAQLPVLLERQARLRRAELLRRQAL